MKKNIKKLLVLPALFLLGSCAGNDTFSGGTGSRSDYYGYSCLDENYYYSGDYYYGDTNEYTEIRDNRFINTAAQKSSYFSMCSSTAAYTNIKNMVMNEHIRPDEDAVMIEQMLNYFKYDYSLEEGESLKIFNEIADCPWNESHKLASIAVKAKEVEERDRKSMNVVFLIDVSGSMSNSLELVKEAFVTLVDNLSANDRISIVTYANKVKTVLNGGSLANKEQIISAINDLKASGGTNGSGGIEKAYSVAEDNFIEGGNNRVILASDGDFNVGISNGGILKDFIKEKREQSHVYLSVFGFGLGNYRNDFAETLAKNGDGNMFYIDSLEEIQRIFSSDLSATFEVVARDVKASVTFDTRYVHAYRLIGYENSKLTSSEYYDTRTDAGEILAGDVTVVLYEIVPEKNVPSDAQYFKSEVRYKDPDSLAARVISNQDSACSLIQSLNFTFQAMVAEYGLLLRNSVYKGKANYQNILDLYDENSEAFDADADRVEFRALVAATQLD